MPTDQEPFNLYSILTIIFSNVVTFFSVKKLNNSQSKKNDADAEVTLRNLEKEEKKEFVEDRIRSKKAMDFLEGQIREMKIDFAQKLDVALSEIARLREENDLITRKYNLQVILNSSTKN